MASILKLQRKYPQFPQSELFQLQDAFRKLDLDDKGYLDEATAIKATQQSERQSYDVVRQALKEVELDSSRRVELEDYVDLISKVRESSPAQKNLSTGSVKPAGSNGAPPRSHAPKPSLGGGTGGKIQVRGHTGTHTINEDERVAFTTHINAVLAGDPDIGQLLPFPTDSFEMFDHCKDGLVLAKLINDSVPDTIDERVMNKPGKKIKSLNAFHMTENNNIVIESAKGIGCSVVNIGAGDIIEVREHLILGLIWQIIRRGLLGKIDIKLHPELYVLLEDGETLEQFLRLPPEQILLRWMNYHLKNAGWHRTVTNFSGDVKDGENYTVLLNQLSPALCSRAPLQTSDLLQRAEQVLQNAEKLDCRKFLTPTALVAGNPKLNLAFVANLFNTHPGLELKEGEKPEIEDFDAEGEREARVFTLFINSLDVQPVIQSFFSDLRDGYILLQAYQKVIPGSVNLKHVNKPPAHGGEMSRFKAVENTNYAVELGKQNHFSLVGIQGADITDGQRTLTLGLVWQLMRRDILNTLASVSQRLGKRELNDADMIKWANEMAQKGGKSSRIRSFKDPAITSGVFLLDVINGIKPGYVDYDLVSNDPYANAKLSISIARKCSCTIFLVGEDIVEGRSRLIMTFHGVKHEGEATGKFSQLGDFEIYTKESANGNNDYGILLITDVIGHRFINAQLIADQLAANNYFVIVPDLFDGDPIQLNRPSDFDIQKWLDGNYHKNGTPHRPPQVDPIIEASIKELRTKYGVKKIGAVGYCFGAKYAVRFLKGHDQIDAAFVAHPSFVADEEIKAITGPLSIAAAETDTIFPNDLRHHTEDLLRELKVPYEITVYAGVQHGFAVRGDLTDPRAKYANEAAFLQSLQWFDYHLKGAKLL
ncbi:hypothetical protein DV736_g753, partial [Chaetothyriales sp. CBS 134916]